MPAILWVERRDTALGFPVEQRPLVLGERLGDRSERHSSSGIIAATGTGATGWARDRG